MEFSFRDHITYVEGCARCADGLITFLADPMELIITVEYEAKLSKSLRRWLSKNTLDLSFPSPEDN